jgi:hypothetical protein
MKALNAYIDQQNAWGKIWGNTPLSLDTAADRKRIAQKIDSALSPENLTCDGELPRAEVNRRYRELTAAAKDLIKLDPSVAQHMYEFG